MTISHALSADGLLAALDEGEELSPAARALILLRLADPHADPAAHADLPIVERDRRLLDLRIRTFGAAFVSAHDCTACGERMEFPLDTAALQNALADAALAIEVEAGGTRWRVRQASSVDLLAVLRTADPSAWRTALLRRCVQTVDGEGGDASMQPSVQEALDRLHEAAELALSALCPVCESDQRVVLDIGSFLWTELRRQAALLIDDVHDLASAYGWSEQAILAMAPARRRAYLDRLRQ
jgi:hypothetical protein